MPAARPPRLPRGRLARRAMAYPPPPQYKTGFHPARLDVQERVWKAEEKKADEERRIVELRKQLEAERGAEELQRLSNTLGGFYEQGQIMVDIEPGDERSTK